MTEDGTLLCFGLRMKFSFTGIPPRRRRTETPGLALAWGATALAAVMVEMPGSSLLAEVS